MDASTESGRSGSIVSRRRVLRGMGAALGTAAVGTTATAGSTDGRDSDDSQVIDHGSEDGPITIAHRGFAGAYPENTIAAMRGAAAAGAEAIEIDLVPCADGTPVVFHDQRLSERTDGGLTDTEGLVWKTDCETVLEAEVLESGETVPTFEAVMEAIPAGVGVTLEFKNPGTMDILPNENLDGETLERQKERWRPFVRDVLDIASRYENDVMAAASREAAIATVREEDSNIPIAFFFSDSIDVGLDITRTYDCEIVWPPINMIERSPFWESPDYYVNEPDFEEIDLVEVAHEEGREIYVFTLNTGYEADQMRMAGVDGILSNYPGLLGFGRDTPTEGTVFEETASAEPSAAPGPVGN